MTVAVSLALGWTVPAQQMSLPSSASMWACLVGQAVLLTGAQLGFIRSTQELPAYVGSVLQVTDIFWGYMLQALASPWSSSPSSCRSVASSPMHEQAPQHIGEMMYG